MNFIQQYYYVIASFYFTLALALLIIIFIGIIAIYFQIRRTIKRLQQNKIKSFIEFLRLTLPIILKRKKR